MSQLHFYVSDEVEKRIRQKARQAKLPLSRYLAELVQRESGLSKRWPSGYLELFDEWQGDAQARPHELVLVTRQGFK